LFNRTRKIGLQRRNCMLNIEGNSIYLRALEPKDLDFLYQIENNSEIWEISGTTTPYSKHVLQQYLDNAHRDIYEVKQLRLVICTKEHDLVGLIDLFDFNPQNKRAGVGIIIEASERNKGWGNEALTLLMNYVVTNLDLHQLYANILADNTASIQLFEKVGFEKVGLKKEWVFSNGNYKDELLYQKIYS